MFLRQFSVCMCQTLHVLHIVPSLTSGPPQCRQICNTWSVELCFLNCCKRVASLIRPETGQVRTLCDLE